MIFRLSQQGWQELGCGIRDSRAVLPQGLGARRHRLALLLLGFQTGTDPLLLLFSPLSN